MMSPLPPDFKSKSFWERPEGQTGKLFLLFIIGGLGFALYHFLPVLILLIQNTLYFGVLLAVLGGVIFMAMDKKVHALIGYAYKGAMRGITKAFVQLDPIAIIETYIEGMRKNLGEMERQREILRGQMRSLQNVIVKNEDDRKKNLQMAHVANQKGVAEVFTLKTRKAGRLEKSNTTLQSLYTKMEMLYRVLEKMQTNAAYLVEDIEDEVDVKKRERNALLAGHNAFRSAMKVIKGDPDQKYMFDQAMEFMVEDIGTKLGEMEHFMEVSQTFMQSVDLQNGIYEEEGLRQLEEWATKGTSLILGNDKALLIDKANNSRELLDLDSPRMPAERRSNKYSSLLENEPK